MALRIVALAAALSAFLVSGCSMVDDHLETRVIAANKGNNAARNDGILLNIIRASDAQPLGFITLSKISGTQNTDLKLGLPTITFGPGLTTSQKQAVFGSNSWENSAQNSYDSAPLESGDFYKAMSSSVDLGIMQSLIRQGYSRELVFGSLIGSIRVETSKGGAYEFRNDPLLNDGSCTPAVNAYGDGATDFGSALNAYSPEANPGQCEFRHFEFLLEAALKWGLNIEAVEKPKNTDKADAGLTVKVAAGAASATVNAPGGAASDAGKSDKAGAAATSSYRFCFDAAYSPTLDLNDPDMKPYLCGAPQTAGTKPNQLRVKFGSNGGGVFTFDIRPRSGLGVFHYLGHAYRAGALGPQLYWSESRVEFSNVEQAEQKQAKYSLVRIKQVSHIGEGLCFAKVLYFGKSYCVPATDTTTTKQLFAMVAQLMALDTTASSLPTTLDVRLQ